MDKDIVYLDEDYLIKLNEEAISLFVQKKADSHELLSYVKLKRVVERCELSKGDFYDKAIILLKGITKAHVFASANRRTAVLAVLMFGKENNQNIYIPNDPSNSTVLIGIRENYYSDKELKNWIKNGEIREFKR